MDSLDLIERYFENGLDEKERADFQRRLETDVAFAQAFQLEKDLMEGIEVMGNQNLREELKGIYAEEIERPKPQAKPKTISRRLWLAAAAAIALLIIAAWYFNRPTPKRLYAAYFQPDFDFVEKGNGNEFAALQAALENKDYKKALPILEDLLKKEEKNSKLILAQGIALVETNKFEEGIKSIQQASTVTPSYKNESLWFQALALLKQGNLKDAKDALLQIEQASGRYNEAQELAEKIQDLIN